MNSRFCTVARIYTIINGLSFIEYLVEAANHKALGASSLLVIKLRSSFNALRVKSKSFVLFIEQEMRIEVILALTDCGMSLGLLWQFFLGALFGPWQTVVLVETVKVWLTTNMIMLRIALKTCFQNLVNLFEEIYYCLAIST